MDPSFSISFEGNALQEIAAFYGFQMLMQPEVQTAFVAVGDLLTAAAQDETWDVFANPSGELADTIHPLASPAEVLIAPDSPYGHRREVGFHGVDSLDRHYDDDGFFYMQLAFDANREEAFQIVYEAVNAALARMVE